MKAVRHVCLLIVMLVCVSGWAQTDVQAPEQGVFNLHKFEQLIGKETYTLTRTPNEVTLKSDFKFTDRGTPVPLTTSLTMEKDLTPRDFRNQRKDFALFFHRRLGAWAQRGRGNNSAG